MLVRLNKKREKMTGEEREGWKVNCWREMISKRDKGTETKKKETEGESSKVATVLSES